MLDASQQFIDHLSYSHTPLRRVGVWLPDEAGVYALQGYLGIETGNLSLDYRRNIRRQATLKVAEYDSTLSSAYLTRDYLERLTSESAEITVDWGLRFSDGSEEWVQLARLRVEESTRGANSRALEITAAYDGASRVADFYLVTPYAPYDLDGNKLTYAEAIQDLVNTSYPSYAPPDWTLAPGLDYTSYPPDNTVFSGDRWAAITDLARAIDVSVGVDSVGGWAIDAPRFNTDPAWTVASGEGGVLVTGVTSYSRREQYNAVGIRWDNADGSGGLAYIVDADPDSPTYYDGPFGRKPRPEETLSTVTYVGQAIRAAATLLEQYKGKTRSVSLTSIHNPLLEPNDILEVHFPDGSIERHVIDSISLPLDGGTMSMETRITRIFGIDYNEADVIYESEIYTYDGGS
jgi:hypothetical protein